MARRDRKSGGVSLILRKPENQRSLAGAHRARLGKGVSEILPSALSSCRSMLSIERFSFPNIENTTIPLNTSPMTNYVRTNNNSDKTTQRDKAGCVGEEREK